MNALQKFEYITQWYATNCNHETSKLKEQNNSRLVSHVETIIGEPIPNDLKELFEKYDGEENSGYGAFIGHSLINLEELIEELNFSRSSMKPENPYISDPDKSQILVDSLNSLYRSIIPKRWGLFKKKWYKLVYKLSKNSSEGPYFYRDKNTSDREYEIPRLTTEQENRSRNLIKQLQELERESYNWDYVECTLYGYDSYSFERKFYNFDDGLSSYPERCIKTIDFHFGWLPLIKDHGGNFIGIDLDPDERGTKGQVIVYGRDEKLMFVLANSWEEFLDLVLGIIKQKPADLLESSHLHNFFRAFIVKR